VALNPPTTKVRLPQPRDIEASLVMVLYGNFDGALATIRAIAQNTEPPYELIVVDNASPDGAGQRLADLVEGARFIFNTHNHGYGIAANLGVLHAKGRYVAVMNSDLEPQPGWLGELISVLDHDPTAAAAVPLYLEPGGQVQEAGILFGGDAIGYGYGDVLQADDPLVAFRRYIDFGSAAASLFGRSEFLACGGFDPIYGTGYYEDSDLSFALRRMGRRTIYAPKARVVHTRHSSFTQSSRRALIERNRPIFLERFADQLAGRPLLRRPPFDPHKDLILRDWWAPERILLLDGTGSLSGLAGELQAAAPTARVTHLRPARPGAEPAHPGVEDLPLPADLPDWLESRRFHYSAAVGDPAIWPVAAEALGRCQPQARCGLVGDPMASVDDHPQCLGARPDAAHVADLLGIRLS
jgi:GT2 family glycosyltransferase